MHPIKYRRVRFPHSKQKKTFFFSIATIKRISTKSFLLLCMTFEQVSFFFVIFPNVDRNSLHFAYLRVNEKQEQSLRVLAYAVYVFLFAIAVFSFDALLWKIIKILLFFFFFICLGSFVDVIRCCEIQIVRYSLNVTSAYYTLHKFVIYIHTTQSIKIVSVDDDDEKKNWTNRGN